MTADALKQITTDEWFGALFEHKNLGAQIISWGVEVSSTEDRSAHGRDV